jgi:GMP synthase-like glutamine amidotransferase
MIRRVDSLIQTVTDSAEPAEPVTTAPAARDGEQVEYAFEKRVASIRVAIVDNLLRSEDDFSDVARRLPGFDGPAWIKRERYIATLALANIENNVKNLVERPDVRIFHLSELTAENMAGFEPDAIVLSGTLRDFDLYDPAMVGRASAYLRETPVPVLGICGGHQLVGQAFGSEIVTLDRQVPAARRENRINEYQYRFVKIVADDPIFHRIDERTDDSSPHVRGRQRVLRVWQNHGLMIDSVPEGFKLLAIGYLCPIQMMVKRTDDQLVYAVQFHIEKSFEDWGRPKSFWDHRIESRDGRIIFDNFLVEALAYRSKAPAPGLPPRAALDESTPGPSALR